MIDTTKRKMDIGVIVRDSEGCVLASICSTKPHISDMIVAQALTT
jgi:hypothetical protein